MTHHYDSSGMIRGDSLDSLSDQFWNPLQARGASVKRVRPLTDALTGDLGASDSASEGDLPSCIENSERWWKEKTGRHFVTSKRKFVALIVDEIRESTRGTGRPMHLGRFFNIVRGGNVRLVREVLNRLTELVLTEELAWVLGTGEYVVHSVIRKETTSKPRQRRQQRHHQRRRRISRQQQYFQAPQQLDPSHEQTRQQLHKEFERERDHHQQEQQSHKQYLHQAKSSTAMRLANIALFPLWMLFFAVLTPVFYLVHAIFLGLHSAFRHRIVHGIELPLVFALLSEDTEMVDCFLQAGSPLERQDQRGNNIYHYLSDISVDAPEKAVRCHQVMCNSVEGVDVLKKLITEQKNHAGMTALETIARYGSPHFLRFILVDKSCIGTLRLGVTRDTLWFSDTHHSFSVSNPLEHASSNQNMGQQPPQQKQEQQQPQDNPDADENTPGSTLNMWEFDISSYEKGDVFRKQSYLLQLVSGRSVEGMSRKDVAGLLNSKLLDRWFGAKYKQYLAPTVLSHAFFLMITVSLLVFVMHNGGDVDPTPLYGTFIHHEINELSKAGYQAVKNVNNRLPPWQNTCHEWNVTWEDEIIDLIHDEGQTIDNCTASALALVMEGCQDTDPRFILSQTLNRSEHMMSTHPVRRVLDYTIFFHVMLDFIIRQGFLWCNYNLASLSVAGAILPVLTRRVPGSYTEKIVSYFMYVLYGWFLYSNRLWSYSLRDRNYHFDQYLRLLNSSNLTEEHERFATVLQDEVHNVSALGTFTGNIVIVCLMLRFLHSIHAMRLLPGIGIFVITTKKMARHLLQFTVIFGIVSLAFATIFFFVMRDINCSPRKSLGFRTLASSLFSTYQVALGYGEYDFKININAVIAYVAYTIISIILLLNLVIAVMTTTVEELNQMPWKEALCCVERWDEILSTELTIQTVLLPLNLLTNFVRYLWSLCHKTKQWAWRNIPLRAKKSFEVIYFE